MTANASNSPRTAVVVARGFAPSAPVHALSLHVHPVPVHASANAGLLERSVQVIIVP